MFLGFHDDMGAEKHIEESGRRKMNLYLIRHGETEWNHARKMQGQMDIPLNENGIRLAEATAEGMKDIAFDRIFSSPLSRAKKTAELVENGRGVAVELKDALKEIAFGLGEGSDINEVKKNPEALMHNFFVHPEQFEPAEGGETFQEVQKRAMDFVKQEILPLEGQVENVAIVAHAVVIRSIMVAVLDREWKDFWKGAYYRNCCVCIVKCRDGRLTALEEGKIYY